MKLFDDLMGLDAALEAAGIPPMFPKWKTEARAFFESGAARWIVRAGRGSAKSHVLVKLGIFEVLLGDWPVPRGGERWFHTHTSVGMQESLPRLNQFAHCFDVLGVPYSRADASLLLANVPRGVRVTAATVAANSGGRAGSYALDEAAKYRTTDGMQNGAEVDASIKATTVTHRDARGYVFSSAWSTDDHHARLVDAGSGPGQYVSTGTTWDFSTVVTEQDTHRLESDAKVWAREYASIPQLTATPAFDAQSVDDAMKPRPLGVPAAAVCIIDSSSGRGDGAASGIVQWTSPAPGNPWLMHDMIGPNGEVLGRKCVVAMDAAGNMIRDPDYREPRPALHIYDVEAVEGRFAGEIDAEQMALRIRDKCRLHNCRHVIGDQHLAYAHEAMLPRLGLRFTSIPFTTISKPEAVTRFRKLLLERSVVLERNEVFKRELLAFSEKLTESGHVKYEARRGHDDRVSIALMACLADINQLVPASPIKRWAGLRTSGPGWGSPPARHSRGY